MLLSRSSFEALYLKSSTTQVSVCWTEIIKFEVMEKVSNELLLWNISSEAVKSLGS